MTLIYLSVENRMSNFIKILFLQGLLLFGISYIELNEINSINLVFVLLETIIFKTVAVPLLLSSITKRHKIGREAEPYVPYFVSLVIVTSLIVFTILLSTFIEDSSLNKIYFIVALFALFTGLYVITTRKKIITHVMGYLVIENGVFILSLAVGNKMPMLVNTGILLDLFVSILVLGIFVNKVGSILKDIDVDQLQNLRD